MKRIISIFFISLLLWQGSFFKAHGETAENQLKKMYLKAKLAFALPKTETSVFVQAGSSFASFFASVKTEKLFDIASLFKSTKSSPPATENTAATTATEFKLGSFGFEFSPLLVNYKGSTQKSLSFYFGRLNLGEKLSSLKTLSFTNSSYSTSKISLPKPNTLSLSTAAFQSDFGFELYLPWFEIAYAATRQAKTNKLDHALAVSYRAENLNAIESSVVTSLKFASTPSESFKKLNGAPKYNFTTGLSLTYTDVNFSLEGNANLSVNAQKQLGFETSLESHNSYKNANVHLGFSYSSPCFIGLKNTFSKNTFAFFIIPKFNFWIADLAFFYNLEKVGLTKKETFTKGSEYLKHEAGAKIQLKNEYFDLITSLKYGERVFKAKVVSTFFSPSIDWLKKCEIEFQSDLTFKADNPYVLKQYLAEILFEFLPMKNFSVNAKFSLEQKNKEKKKSYSNGMLPIIEWQPVQYGLQLSLDADLKGKYGSHSISLKVKGFNKAPYYSANIEYLIKL